MSSSATCWKPISLRRARRRRRPVLPSAARAPCAICRPLLGDAELLEADRSTSTCRCCCRNRRWTSRRAASCAAHQSCADVGLGLPCAHHHADKRFRERHFAVARTSLCSIRKSAPAPSMMATSLPRRATAAPGSLPAVAERGAARVMRWWPVAFRSGSKVRIALKKARRDHDLDVGGWTTPAASRRQEERTTKADRGMTWTRAQ